MKRQIKLMAMALVLGPCLKAVAVGKPKPVDPPASVTDLTNLVLGTVARAGAGCEAVEGALVVVRADRLTVSTDLIARKALDSNLARASCNVSIPTVVPKDTRLIISRLRLAGKAELADKAAASISIEVFKSGDKGQVIVESLEAKQGVTQAAVLEREEILLQSECGEAFNLRANLSVIVKGPGEASVDLGATDLQAHLEKCN